MVNSIRLAGIDLESVVDGNGIRMTIFAQGCKHHCPGCHNPQTHDLRGGEEVPLEKIKKMMDSNPLLDGLTLSGGEPFLQPQPLQALSRYAHSKKMDVWCYSGYTFEQLCALSQKDENVKALLKEIDVLVDGLFEKEQMDLTLKFRGSSNQRVIDMKKTLATGEIVWLEGMR